MEYRKQEFASYADMKGDVKESDEKSAFGTGTPLLHTAEQD